MYDVNRERLIKIFIDLVRIPSPSWKEKRLLCYLIEILKDLNIEYEKYKCGDSYNLIARINGDLSRKPVLFVSHMDTVVPCDNVNPIISRQPRLM